MNDTTLFDFEPEKVREREKAKEEDQKIMELIGKFTARMLKDALRGNGGQGPCILIAQTSLQKKAPQRLGNTVRQDFVRDIY